MAGKREEPFGQIGVVQDRGSGRDEFIFAPRSLGINQQRVRAHASNCLVHRSAVAHQQLNGTAANTILTRFIKLFPGRKFPKPEDLDKVTDEQIRACGFSFAKIRAIRDIAEKTLSGVVPTSRQIVKLTDEEIILRLTEVRGVGRWTVEMLLIFQLGRENVLPADDFGVRSGFRRAYKKRELPKPKALLKFGERWRPHATTAAWYLWRAADTDKKK